MASAPIKPDQGDHQAPIPGSEIERSYGQRTDGETPRSMSPNDGSDHSSRFKRALDAVQPVVTGINFLNAVRALALWLF